MVNGLVGLLNQVNPINQVNHLTTKQKILVLIYNKELSIVQISKKLKLSLQNVSVLITRKNRLDGLLDNNLIQISKIDGSTKYYLATNKGRGEF